MRRVDKELKKVRRNLKQLEECICMPICKDEGIIPWSGNGCKTKVECDLLKDYFVKNPGRVESLLVKRAYLREQINKGSLYARQSPAY